MLLDILFWLTLFITSYIAIYFLADFIIDNLEDVSDSFSISPIVLGLVILGIDLEESIVSLTAAMDGLPYLALGNLIGNTVIAIGIAFGIPALYLKVEIDQLPRFYYVELVVAGAIVLVSMILTSYLVLFGILSLILFIFHIIYTWQIQSEFRSSILLTKSNERVQPIDEATDSIKKSHNRLRTIVELLIALVFLSLAGEVLVNGAQALILLTGLNESFFGLVIMAAVTNAEEFWLIAKSIGKGRTELGVSAQVGKIVWNITLIFGICSILLVQFTFQPVMLLSSVVFIITISVLVVNLFQNRSSKSTGIVYLLLLLIFLVLNSLFVF